MKVIRILDKEFKELIEEEIIQKRVGELAEQINRDYAGKGEIILVGILNGAFVFAADLIRKMDIEARITFVKLASYQGTGSSGEIKELIGWNEDLKGRQVIILEDIVDSGETLEKIVNELVSMKVAGIGIAVMFLKPGAYSKNIPIDYTGFEIPDDFVVGYGLDYNGFGRNLPSVYALIH